MVASHAKLNVPAAGGTTAPAICLGSLVQGLERRVFGAVAGMILALANGTGNSVAVLACRFVIGDVIGQDE